MKANIFHEWIIFIPLYVSKKLQTCENVCVRNNEFIIIVEEDNSFVQTKDSYRKTKIILYFGILGLIKKNCVFWTSKHESVLNECLFNVPSEIDVCIIFVYVLVQMDDTL